MKAKIQALGLLLTVLFATSVQATTGIDSVSYLWGAALVMLLLIAVLVMLVKFLKNVRKDTIRHQNVEDE